jgi:hypothetical protein
VQLAVVREGSYISTTQLTYPLYYVTSWVPQSAVPPTGSSRPVHRNLRLLTLNPQHLSCPFSVDTFFSILFCVGGKFLAFYWTLFYCSPRNFFLPSSYFVKRKEKQQTLAFLYWTYDDSLGFTSFGNKLEERRNGKTWVREAVIRGGTEEIGRRVSPHPHRPHTSQIPVNLFPWQQDVRAEVRENCAPSPPFVCFLLHYSMGWDKLLGRSLYFQKASFDVNKAGRC